MNRRVPNGMHGGVRGRLISPYSIIIELRKTITPQGDYTKMKRNIQLLISEEFAEKWGLWEIVGFLEKFGISASNCKKVYETFGANAITEIEANPYMLLDITYGVDFKKIDKMAMDLGIAKENAKRAGVSEFNMAFNSACTT